MDVSTINCTIGENCSRYVKEMGPRGPEMFGGKIFLEIIPPFLIWNLIVILVVALIFYWLTRGARKTNETPLDLLKKRYASGGIDRQTFLDMKKDLTE